MGVTEPRAPTPALSLPGSGPPPRTGLRVDPAARKWNAIFKALTGFVREWPAIGTTGTEGVVTRWISEQRRQHRLGALPADQVARLDGAPCHGDSAAVPWPMKNGGGPGWKRSSAIAETSDLAHVETEADEHERTLGVWIHNQRQRQSRGGPRRGQVESPGREVTRLGWPRACTASLDDMRVAPGWGWNLRFKESRGLPC